MCRGIQFGKPWSREQHQTVEQTLQNIKNKKISHKSNSEKSNLLIHGLNESKETWETTTQTKTVITKIFRRIASGLKRRKIKKDKRRIRATK